MRTINPDNTATTKAGIVFIEYPQVLIHS
jgi:hypothetical protein